MKMFLTSIFGQEQLPSEAEILLFFNQKITRTLSVDMSNAFVTGDDREHPHSAAQMLPVATRLNEKKTGMQSVRTCCRHWLTRKFFAFVLLLFLLILYYYYF